MRNLYIGLMSGTSMDAIDAVLVDFSYNPLRLLNTYKYLLPLCLRRELITFSTKKTVQLSKFAKLDQKIALVSSEAVQNLLSKTPFSNKNILAIGSHGQTISHRPYGSFPHTIQIGDPNIIAEKTGITTIADFRRRDIAAGGQGAPLTPAFHHFVFRTPKEDRIVLNLGGIANITYLPSNLEAPILGFDVGPANCLLDLWIQKNCNRWFDDCGLWAASTPYDTQLLQQFLKDPYFQKTPPKSTGPEYFNLDWLQQHQGFVRRALTPATIQATFCELTAITVAAAIQQFKSQQASLILCGGGSKNTYLKSRLAEQCYPHRLVLSDDQGIPSEWLEAMAFAWLAKQTLDGKASNLPRITGAKKATVLGGIYRSFPADSN